MRRVVFFTVAMLSIACVLGMSSLVGIPSAAQSYGLCVRYTVPFLWVRNAPSSSAAVLYTTYPTDCALRSMEWLNQKTAWDGVQTWVQVYIIDPTKPGWVEENRVYNPAKPQPTPTGQPPPPRLTGQTFSIRPQVPFVWLRSIPSSYAPALNTLRPPYECDLGLDPEGYGGGSNPLFWDGVQWWLHVGLIPEVGRTNSWVELQSLLACS